MTPENQKPSERIKDANANAYTPAYASVRLIDVCREFDALDARVKAAEEETTRLRTLIYGYNAPIPGKTQPAKEVVFPMWGEYKVQPKPKPAKEPLENQWKLAKTIYFASLFTTESYEESKDKFYYENIANRCMADVFKIITEELIKYKNPEIQAALHHLKIELNGRLL